ncbi:hypothetical protein Ciccas_002963 [Cichlidogyrus casuarinus]|uniref:G-protein coupled receptors family 1 profile domain-containing protein n=1 Tax=Cichlidogyrus casuarinus TaxID=1844966 RepID=A0ABD2QGC9_9PLAT
MNSSAELEPCWNFDDLRTEWYMAIYLILILFTFVTAFVGNLFVVLTVSRDPTMRNATNLFIRNLSTADLLYIVFVSPFNVIQNMFQNYYWGQVICASMAFAQATCVSTSSFTLSVIAFDRSRKTSPGFRQRIGVEEERLMMCSGGVDKVQTYKIVKMLALVVLVFGTSSFPPEFQSDGNCAQTCPIRAVVWFM